MNNFNTSETNGTNPDDMDQNNTSEQKTDDSEQNNRGLSEEKLSENEIKGTTKFDENLMIIIDNIDTSSTITQDTIIDLTDKVSENVGSKKDEQLEDQSIPLQKYIKLGIREHSREFLHNQANREICVQYSFGQGRGSGKGSDDDERKPFIRLVLIIVLVLLIITAAWITVVFTVPTLNKMFAGASKFYAIGIGIAALILDYAMMCIPAVRKPPCGAIILILMVILLSLLASLVGARFKAIIVCYAFLTTTVIVIFCTVLACTRFDFTSLWLYFAVIVFGFAAVAMCIGVGMLIAGTYLKILHICILCGLVTLQSVGLVMEMQMIMGGKSVEIEEDDYIYAAFLLYTSIVRIFINLMKILGLLDA